MGLRNTDFFFALADEWVDLLLVGRRIGFARNKEMTELGLPWRGIDLPAGRRGYRLRHRPF